MIHIQITILGLLERLLAITSTSNSTIGCPTPKEGGCGPVDCVLRSRTGVTMRTGVNFEVMGLVLRIMVEKATKIEVSNSGPHTSQRTQSSCQSHSRRSRFATGVSNTRGLWLFGFAKRTVEVTPTNV